MGFLRHVGSNYPFPGLVFKEWLDERVQGMNVPGLVDKMDSSKAGRKAVLGRKEKCSQLISTSGWKESVALQPHLVEALASRLRKDENPPSFPAVSVSSIFLASLLPL